MMPSFVLQRTRSGAYTQRVIGIEVCPHVEGRPELAPLLALTRVGTLALATAVATVWDCASHVVVKETACDSCKKETAA